MVGHFFTWPWRWLCKRLYSLSILVSLPIYTTFFSIFTFNPDLFPKPNRTCTVSLDDFLSPFCNNSVSSANCESLWSTWPIRIPLISLFSFNVIGNISAHNYNKYVVGYWVTLPAASLHWKPFRCLTINQNSWFYIVIKYVYDQIQLNPNAWNTLCIKASGVNRKLFQNQYKAIAQVDCVHYNSIHHTFNLVFFPICPLAMKPDWASLISFGNTLLTLSYALWSNLVNDIQQEMSLQCFRYSLGLSSFWM